MQLERARTLALSNLLGLAQVGRVVARLVTGAFVSGVPVAAVLAPTAAVADNGRPVWVVDDDGGAGTDFVDLQPAIDAAADGDLILVRPGLYDGFAIVGKGVNVVAEVEGTVVCLASAIVRQVPEASVVSLRGLRTVPIVGPGLLVENCAGTTWVEACALRGAAGDGFVGSPTFHPDGYAGMAAIDGGDVVVLRSTLEGGAGSNLFGAVSIQGDGGDGAAVAKTELALYDCTCRGGDGGSAATDKAAADGGDGGAGLAVDASGATGSGSLFFGGDGGAAGALVVDSTTHCGDAGDGGHGIGQPSMALGAAEVRLLDCLFSPGVGGPALVPSQCNDGDLGSPILIPFGSIDGLAGPSFRFETASPVRLGEDLLFEMAGEPGAVAVLGISTSPAPIYDPAYTGSVLVDSNLVLTFPGQIAFDGTLTYNWIGALDVRSHRSLSVYAQPIFFVPSTSALTVGPGTFLTVLDPTL